MLIDAPRKLNLVATAVSKVYQTPGNLVYEFEELAQSAGVSYALARKIEGNRPDQLSNLDNLAHFMKLKQDQKVVFSLVNGRNVAVGDLSDLLNLGSNSK